MVRSIDGRVMLAMRHSGATATNSQVKRVRSRRGEGNRAWLARLEAREGVVLFGGASLVDVRVRFAQSVLRADLTPSHWSHAGLLVPGETVMTVPLEIGDDPSAVVAANGIRTLPLEAYDDSSRFPNVAWLSFTDRYAPVFEAAEAVRLRRAMLDLPALVVAWLSAAWGVSDLERPLREGLGVPGAAFVETCHAICRLELTPGLTSTASCPEAIWQSARWWAEYYRESATVARRAAVTTASTAGHGTPRVPAGAYVLRHPTAAMLRQTDAPQALERTATERRGRTR